MLLALPLLVLGFALLIKGADWLVDGSSALARKLGVSDLAIGLTIVAFGTSMPEFMVNMVASVQGASDIAIGNIVGSNIFNIFWILGVSAIIRPIPFPPAANLDLWVLVATTVLLFFLIHNGQIFRRIFLWWRQSDHYIIRRWEGMIMLLCYCTYVAYISWRG
jgi:cation:H+ antiporter